MKVLKLVLENCYGINKLDDNISFENDNISVIYAPNGTMKTSFANTFNDLAKGAEPRDRVRGLPTICEVKDENDNTIRKEEILVINSFDQRITDEQNKLMADPELQKEYNKLHTKLENERKRLFDNIKQQLKYNNRHKFDALQTMCEVFSKSDKHIYELLKEIIDIIETGTKANFKIDDIEYSILFAPQSLKFYKQGDNNKLLKRYSEKYEELIDKSKFLHKGVFDHRNFSNVAQNLNENGFFKAKHKILIQQKKDGTQLPPILNEQEFQKLLEEEKERVINNKEMRSIFEKLSNEIAANKGTKKLDEYLQSKPEIILELDNIEEFKKKIWIELIRENMADVKKLMTIFVETSENLNKVERKAKNQETSWHKVLQIFKRRFHVPFRIESDNQEDVILHNKIPIFKYIFDLQKGNEVTKKEDELLDILSTGEKRAYYLLDLIYKVELRAKENKATFLILDDIADSFDYKNKYAIIEYINDIKNREDTSGKKLFTVLVLTHNFDFYRTVGSRLTKRNNCYIASKTKNLIALSPCQYLKNYFTHIKQQCLNKDMTFIIAAIPFVRNLIEYTYEKTDVEYKDYEILTNLLHDKPISNNVLITDLQRIFNKYWLNGKGTFGDGKKSSVYDLIFITADSIAVNPLKYNSINVENKIVLSIAIRLLGEKYIIDRIKTNLPDGQKIISDIQSRENQTMALYSKYREKLAAFPVDESKILEKVIMMTPENIHLNSFMYEPILDMQGTHLVELHNAVKSL